MFRDRANCGGFPSPRRNRDRNTDPHEEQNLMVSLKPGEAAHLRRFENGAVYVHRFNTAERGSDQRKGVQSANSEVLPWILVVLLAFFLLFVVETFSKKI